MDACGYNTKKRSKYLKKIQIKYNEPPIDFSKFYNTDISQLSACRHQLRYFLCQCIVSMLIIDESKIENMNNVIRILIHDFKSKPEMLIEYFDCYFDLADKVYNTNVLNQILRISILPISNVTHQYGIDMMLATYITHTQKLLWTPITGNGYTYRPIIQISILYAVATRNQMEFIVPDVEQLKTEITADVIRQCRDHARVMWDMYIPKKVKICNVCKSKDNIRMCKCKGVYYCSVECQTIDWKQNHKHHCIYGPIGKKKEDKFMQSLITKVMRQLDTL